MFNAGNWHFIIIIIFKRLNVFVVESVKFSSSTELSKDVQGDGI